MSIKKIFGKYVIIYKIGQGFNSVTYLIKNEISNKLMAMKCIPREVGEVCVNREADILKRLCHKGIPRFYRLESDNNYYYLIMEYIHGNSLQSLVQSRGQISKSKLIYYGIQLCNIIFYLHSIQPDPIIYLDLQPNNIIVHKNKISLIDFGNALYLSEVKCQKKRYGTIGFAAPEQFGIGSLTVQTDIYSLGLVLYYMAKNKTYMEDDFRDDFGYTCLKLDKDLKDVINACIQYQPILRYSTVMELKKDLISIKKRKFVGNI